MRNVPESALIPDPVGPDTIPLKVHSKFFIYQGLPAYPEISGEERFSYFHMLIFQVRPTSDCESS